MPSTIGHLLAGAAVAWTGEVVSPPLRLAKPWRLTVVCAAIAAAPDLDLLWRTHRTVTHSIGATAVVGAVAGVWAARARLPAWRLAAVCAAAHASHIFLDWLAADQSAPYGIQALWPFSADFYISGLDLFRQTVRRHFFTLAAVGQNAVAIAQEIAILGPIAWVAWLVRVKALTGLAAETSGRHHPAQ
jgi:inner membrane protein